MITELSHVFSLNDLRALCSERLEKVYAQYLHDIPSAELKTAMEYTLFNNGKRLRPLLIYATGFIFDAPLQNLDIPGASVEAIHTYSLIHDDLPCMDDADLRRGQPTCHKVFDEGLAVLTGDALHTLAMQIISSHAAPLSAEKRTRMMKVLSQACGPHGMAAGQALDITVMSKKNITSDLLEPIYKLKTGALFSACIELGWLASADNSMQNQLTLRKFGDLIGLAFQIQDDILDIEMPSEQSGKPQGIDQQNAKITYPNLHGLTQAKQMVGQLYQEALEALYEFGEQARLLRDLTSYMLSRQK